MFRQFAYIREDIVHLQDIKVIFLKLFLICMFKDLNLLQNLTNLKENLKQKFNSAELMEFCFLQVCWTVFNVAKNHTITYNICILSCCFTT